MRLSIGLIAHGVFVISLLPGMASAAIWMEPTGPSYQFNSLGTHTVVDTPFGALTFTGTGPTIARSDPTNAAFAQTGLDTINTEILSLTITGTMGGSYAELRAGLGQGFPGFIGLTQPTRGQVQDQAGSPTSGSIDFPANSIFDVFFDVWVDANGSGSVDVGEVFSNDTSGLVAPGDFAARMSNMMLLNIPPPVGTIYTIIGGVSENDPMIGTFATTAPSLVYLYQISPDRNPLGESPFGRLDAAAHEVIITEPAPLALLGTGLGLLGLRRRAKAG